MSDNVIEATFQQFPVSVRLEILYALQEVAMLSADDERARHAADVLVQFGYLDSADTALKARATLAAL